MKGDLSKTATRGGAISVVYQDGAKIIYFAISQSAPFENIYISLLDLQCFQKEGVGDN